MNKRMDDKKILVGYAGKIWLMGNPLVRKEVCLWGKRGKWGCGKDRKNLAVRPVHKNINGIDIIY
ncbi:MAG: hypothetical protein E7256_14035 [Lachnospiraceae bacterium]|nr:hypothetical protein [Lachnospiraceae bacterium]